MLFRGQDTVKHYQVAVTESEIDIGYRTFANLKEFVQHFNSQPLIAGKSGKTPYNRQYRLLRDIYHEVGISTQGVVYVRGTISRTCVHRASIIIIYYTNYMKLQTKNREQLHELVSNSTVFTARRYA